VAHISKYLKAAGTIMLLSVAATATAATRGERVYQGTCIACHGAEGEGTMPGVPDLTAPKGPLSKLDDELMKNITYGFRSPGSYMSMPPKGGNPRLNREDIEAVISYMRDTFSKR